MRSIPKPLAGLVFVLFWGIAIALWSCTHLLPTHDGRGFMADIGIVFASIGFAAPFLASMKNLLAAAILGIIGIVLFGAFGFLNATVLVYMLRLLVPFLALLTPLYKLLSFRVFA
jgi:hypothetical protein